MGAGAWQRRWFILNEYDLRYYIKQQPPVPFDEPRGTIHLKDVTRVQPTPSVWKDPGLQVITPRRTYVFKSKSEPDRDSWIAAINAACGDLFADPMPPVLLRQDSKAAKMLVGK